MKKKFKKATFQHLRSATNNRNTHTLSYDSNSNPKNTQEGDACI